MKIKIRIEKKQLVKYLVALTGITKGSLQLPILSMVLWEVKKGKITLEATDLNSGIIFNIEGKAEGEGDFLISLNGLLEYSSTLGEGEVVMDVGGEKIEISQNGSRASLPIAKRDDFPVLKKTGEKEDFKISLDIFVNAVRRVGIAVAMDGTRPVLSGILLKRFENKLVLVGTDGYRLGLENVCKQEGGDFDLLISIKALNNVLKALDVGDIVFEIDKRNKQLWIKQKACQVFLRLIDGTFPDFNRIIPQNFSTKVSFEKEELQLAVNQTAVFARQNANIVKMEINEKVKLLTQSGYSGSSEVVVEAKKEGEDCLIAFNYRYLKDVMSIFGNGNIVFELNGPLAPVKIVSETDLNFFHIIMPVKL